MIIIYLIIFTIFIIIFGQFGLVLILCMFYLKLLHKLKLLPAFLLNYFFMNSNIIFAKPYLILTGFIPNINKIFDTFLFIINIPIALVFSVFGYNKNININYWFFIGLLYTFYNLIIKIYKLKNKNTFNNLKYGKNREKIIIDESEVELEDIVSMEIIDIDESEIEYLDDD